MPDLAAEPLPDLADADEPSGSDEAMFDASDIESQPDVPPPPECTAETAAADCDDFLPCTRDECEQGYCVHVAVAPPTCCENDGQCDDGVACTDDRCRFNECHHMRQTSECCTTAADCNDFLPCSLDSCQANQCQYADDPTCCQEDGACDDFLTWTTDACLANRCHHMATATPTVCAADEQCSASSACARGSCLVGWCTWVVEPGASCCTAMADCDDGSPCTADRCDQWECTQEPVVGPVVQWSESFDTPELPPGWQFESSDAAVYWHPDPTVATSPPFSLHFANPATEQYDNGSAVSGQATSPAVVLPAQGPVLLHLRLLLDLELISSRDVVLVQLLCDGETTVLWTKLDIVGDITWVWHDIALDLSAWSGRTVQLRLAFDTIDALDNAYQGVYLDDLQILWPCS